jgi:nucleolar GTP-binding protein
MSRGWRLLSSSSSSGTLSLATRPIHSSTKAPYKTHRRQLNQLERAAAIGLAALQAQQQGSPLAADDTPVAAAGAAVSSLPFGPPPAVAQLQLQKPKKKVGALQKVPVISPPDELAASALKRALKVQPAAGLKNEADKERSRAAKQLDTHMKELSVPLSRYLKSFPPLSALHPFEAALLDLTVGAATYASVLGKADALRKSIQEVCMQEVYVVIHITPVSHTF